MWPSDIDEHSRLARELQRNSQWIRRLPDGRKIEEGPRGNEIPPLHSCRQDDFLSRLNDLPRPLKGSTPPHESASTKATVKAIMRKFPQMSETQAMSVLEAIHEEIQTFMDKMRKRLGTEDTSNVDVLNAVAIVNYNLSRVMQAMWDFRTM